MNRKPYNEALDELAQQEPHLVSHAARRLNIGRVAIGLKIDEGSAYNLKDPKKDPYTRFLQEYYTYTDAGKEIIFADFARRHHAEMEQTKASNSPAWNNDIGRFWRTAGNILKALLERDGLALVKEGSKMLQMAGELITYGRQLLKEKEEEAERAVEGSRFQRGARRGGAGELG